MSTSALIKPAEAVISMNRSAQAGGNIMRFPKDIGAHAMILNFKEYEYAGGAVTNAIVGNSIVLPLPKNIMDSYKVTIDEGRLGIIGAGIAEAVTKGVNVGALANTDFSSVSSDPAAAAAFFVNGGLLAAAGGVATKAFGGSGVLGGLISGAASQPVGQALSAASGTMINPHTTVMFTGVGLKTHQFDWTLSPKSAEESKTLKTIINEFRKATLPSYTSPVTNTGTSLDRSLLRYPKMVDIFFVGLDQSYYYYFKTCMINQLNIDYSGQSGNALYAGENGAKPVMINLQIGLTESTIHTREDYEESDGSSAGGIL